MAQLKEILYLNNFNRLSESQQRLLLEENVGTLRDVIQGAFSAAAEYGLLATVVGAPAAPEVETAIDLLFLSNAIDSTLDLLGKIGQDSEKVQAIFEAVFNEQNYDLSVGFDQFYENIKNVWQRIDELVPEFGENVDEYVDLVKSVLDRAMLEVARVIGDALKVTVPDSVASFALAQAIKRVLVSASNNSYTLMTSAIGISSTFEEFIQNPQKAEEVFDKLYDKLIEILIKLADKIDEESSSPVASRIIATGAATALAGPLAGLLVATGVSQKYGSRGIRSAAKFLEDHKQDALELINSVFQTIIPAAFALAASRQILLRGEYSKEQETENQPESLQEVIFNRNRLLKLSGIIK